MYNPSQQQGPPRPQAQFYPQNQQQSVRPQGRFSSQPGQPFLMYAPVNLPGQGGYPNTTPQSQNVYLQQQMTMNPYGQRMPSQQFALPTSQQLQYPIPNQSYAPNSQSVYYPTNQSSASSSVTQQPQRPPSAPVTSQTNYQKREKKIIEIVDPDSGKDITDEILHAKNTPPSSSRGTPVGTGSGSTSSSPPPGASQKLVAAQFAEQVAATLRPGSTNTQPARPPSVPQQLMQAPVVDNMPSLPVNEDMSVPPPMPPIIPSQVFLSSAQCLVAPQPVLVPPPPFQMETPASNPESALPPVQYINNPEIVKPVISASVEVFSPQTDLSSESSERTDRSSSERSKSQSPVEEVTDHSVTVSEKEDVVPTEMEVPVQESNSQPTEWMPTASVETAESVEPVEDVTDDKQQQEAAAAAAPVTPEFEPVTTAAAGAAEPAKEIRKEKGKRKMKDLNKKGESKEGTDMDAFIVPETAASEETKIEQEVEMPVVEIKVEPVAMEQVVEPEIVTPEAPEPVTEPEPEPESIPNTVIIIEDAKVQEENEKNKELSDESNEKQDSELSSAESQLKYSYKEDQWSPLNPEGKRQYDREFLLVLQFEKESTTKPEGLPYLPDVILDEPHSKENTRQAMYERPPHSSHFDFTPGYVKSPRMSGSMGGSGGGGGKRQSMQRNKEQKKIIPSVSMNRNVQLHQAENAWKPSSHSEKKEKPKADDSSDAKTQELYKKVMSILNKLTPQKFQTLLQQMQDLTIDTEQRLSGVTDLVFEKAISEPGFCVAYANMCRYLLELKVPSTKKSGDVVNFRAILLTRCQQEFEKDKQLDDEIIRFKKEIEEQTDSDKKKQLQDDLNDKVSKAKRKSLGNIRFIGELFKLKMLTANIMHDCVFKLLRSRDEENLECLCRLLTTIGKELDIDKAKPRMDQYFQQMNKIITEKKTSSRVRFMLQDVRDLRLSNWVPRRDENNPKTIDQIHKDVAREEQERALLRQQASLQKRSARPARGQPGQPSGPMNNPDDGWNTVSSSKIIRGAQTVDPTKLKFSKQNIDENIQLGPGGSRFSGWRHGSSGGGSRASQEKEKQQLNTPSNRFSALSGKQEDENRRFGRPGVSPARGDNRGRGSQSGGYPGKITGRMSQEDDRRKALSAVRNIGGVSGRSTPPSGGTSRESSASREPTENVKPSAPVKQLTNEEMEHKTKQILDEYLHIRDLQEAKTCVKELNTPPNIHVFVTSAINSVLERSEVARKQTGSLLHDLVREKIITVETYLKGLKNVLEYAEDMEIDIPKIWKYLGELIGPMVQDESVSLSFLKEAVQGPLLDSGKAGVLIAEVLHDASNRLGHKKVGELWRHSGLLWFDFVSGDLEEFIKDKKLEFTVSGDSQPTTPTGIPMYKVSQQLTELLCKKMNNEAIFDWIEEFVEDHITKQAKFIRTLMTAVCSNAITGEGSSRKVAVEQIKKRSDLLQKYLDHQGEFELQALYAVQALVVQLEHPAGILRSLFDVLYDEDIISEDAFNQWEKSTDPNEQEGKGVAMKQVVQFFAWLKEADEESAQEDS